MKRHELTDKQWNRLRELLPPQKPIHGDARGKTTDRCWMGYCTSWIPWRDLPERYGLWKSVYTRIAVGVSKAYGSMFLRNWLLRTLWMKAIWYWTAPRSKSTNMTVGLKMGRWSPWTQSGRIEHKGSCGSGRTWQPSAAHAVCWQPHCPSPQRASMFFALTLLAAILIWIVWVWRHHLVFSEQIYF